jgi:hypothetical protein
MFGIRLVCRDEMMFGCPLEQPPMTGRSILLYNHEAHSDLREPLFADRLRQDVRVSHCLACMHGDAVRSSRERVEPITSIRSAGMCSWEACLCASDAYVDQRTGRSAYTRGPGGNVV